eukprot:9876047-Prorocentrum_lima.AAC.1
MPQDGAAQPQDRLLHHGAPQLQYGPAQDYSASSAMDEDSSSSASSSSSESRADELSSDSRVPLHMDPLFRGVLAE